MFSLKSSSQYSFVSQTYTNQRSTLQVRIVALQTGGLESSEVSVYLPSSLYLSPQCDYFPLVMYLPLSESDWSLELLSLKPFDIVCDGMQFYPCQQQEYCVEEHHSTDNWHAYVCGSNQTLCPLTISADVHIESAELIFSHPSVWPIFPFPSVATLTYMQADFFYSQNPDA